MFEILNADIGFITDTWDKVAASNSLALIFSVVINVFLYRGYKSEEKYNRKRDSEVTKIITLMQSRLEDLKDLTSAFNKVENIQTKNTMLLEQVHIDVREIKSTHNA